MPRPGVPGTDRWEVWSAVRFPVPRRVSPALESMDVDRRRRVHRPGVVLHRAGALVTRVKRSIELWVVARGGEVLLLHVGDAEVPFWQPVTGGIRDGEGAREAAVRELGEETGLRIDPASLSRVAEGVRVRIDDGLEIDKTLFTVQHPRASITIDPAEHDDSAWVPADGVAAMLHWRSNRDTWRLIRGATGL